MMYLIMSPFSCVFLNKSHPSFFGFSMMDALFSYLFLVWGNGHSPTAKILEFEPSNHSSPSFSVTCAEPVEKVNSCKYIHPE